jgi:F0F1-type ATP synthase delta subunit
MDAARDQSFSFKIAAFQIKKITIENIVDPSIIGGLS